MVSEPTNAPKAKRATSNTVMAASALGLSVLAAGAAALALYGSLGLDFDTSTGPNKNQAPAVESQVNESNDQDLFAPPNDLSALIENVQRSTVTIRCKKSQGSGWVLDLGAPSEDASAEYIEIDRMFPYEVITNHHVIEDCVDSPERVRARAGEEEYDAYLYSWDEKNDLAIVAISQEVPPLEISTKPQPGWWAMAIGTPYGLEGSISIGNVMNTERSDIIATTPLNSGNSGGPMVNSRGQVMGTNTWVLVEDDAQDWNVAVGTPALCDAVVLCEEGDGFSWE